MGLLTVCLRRVGHARPVVLCALLVAQVGAGASLAQAEPVYPTPCPELAALHIRDVVGIDSRNGMGLGGDSSTCPPYLKPASPALSNISVRRLPIELDPPGPVD